MNTPLMAIEVPATVFVIGVVSVTVTTLPASLMLAMLELCPARLGKLIMLTAPNPVGCVDWKTGLNEAIASTPPGNMLAAAATYSLDLLGEMAMWVGLKPLLGALAVDVDVSPIRESPETSICIAPPALLGMFVLMPITA
jgi:hypothetical protein